MNGTCSFESETVALGSVFRKWTLKRIVRLSESGRVVALAKLSKQEARNNDLKLKREQVSYRESSCHESRFERASRKEYSSEDQTIDLIASYNVDCRNGEKRNKIFNKSEVKCEFFMKEI